MTALGRLTDPMAAIAPVPGLLQRRCPPTVFGRVVLRRVDTVKRPTLWPLAHVGEETQERAFGSAIGLCSPSLTDPDAATAVIAPSDIVWLVAAVIHALPALIGSRTAHAVSREPLPVFTVNDLLAAPSTLRRLSTPQTGNLASTQVAAIAANNGIPAGRIAAVGGNHGPFPETNALKLGSFRFAGLVTRLRSTQILGCQLAFSTAITAAENIADALCSLFARIGLAYDRPVPGACTNG
jgi:hypothetical protein